MKRELYYKVIYFNFCIIVGCIFVLITVQGCEKNKEVSNNTEISQTKNPRVNKIFK